MVKHIMQVINRTISNIKLKTNMIKYQVNLNMIFTHSLVILFLVVSVVLFSDKHGFTSEVHVACYYRSWE